MKRICRFLFLLLTVFVLPISCSDSDNYLERSMLSGIYSISTPSDSPAASGSWTDGLRRYIEFNETSITVYYELTCMVRVPVSSGLEADIIDEDGSYYRVDEVVSYFRSNDTSDKNLQFDCDKDIVNTNAIYYSGPVFQYNVKERSDNEIVLTRSNDIVVLSVIKDELKLKSLKAAQESDYNDMKTFAENLGEVQGVDNQHYE